MRYPGRDFPSEHKPPHRQPGKRYLMRPRADRREFTVLDVIDALVALSQPELLRTDADHAGIALSGGKSGLIETGTVLTPEAQLLV